MVEKEYKQLKKNINLDCIRIIAMAMVLLTHFGQHYEYLVQYTAVGAQGVLLFYILSGYLTMYSLERKNIKQFYKSRIKKIVPLYYTVLILIYFYDLLLYRFFYGVSYKDIFSADGVCSIKYIRYFFFGHMFIPSNHYSWWNNRYALWTMSAFAFFYIVAPLIYRCGKRFLGSITILGIFLVLTPILRLTIIKWGTNYAIDEIVSFAYGHPFTQLYCFLLGTTLYFSIKSGYTVQYIFAIVIVSIFSGQYQMEVLFLVLLYVAIREKDTVLNNSVKIRNCILRLSKISFEMYLCHSILLQSVLHILDALNVTNVLVTMLIAFSVVIMFSYMLNKSIEKITGFLCSI